MTGSAEAGGPGERDEMNEVLAAVGIMAGLTAFFGALLAVAHRYLRVEEDPRLEEISDRLPGTNCGSCGRPGCLAFAEELVGGSAAPGECTVSSPEALRLIADFLGIDVGLREKRVARLHCAGGLSSVRKIATYVGLPSCRAAFVVGGGGRACPWGCLGYGDCERACTFGAIRMDDEALPVVDVDLCTACNDCVEVCPLDLFTLEPLSSKVIVQCSAPLTAEAARAVCRVACDACGRCAVDAPAGAIEMQGGLPVLKQPAVLAKDCTLRCPTGAIRFVEKNQFEEAGARVAAAPGERHA